MEGVNIWRKELENGPVQERLEREFDRLNQLGRVSAECALQFKGQSPHGQLYAIGGPDVGGSLAHGDGRKATPESGRTPLLNAARGSTLAGLSDHHRTRQSEGDGKTKQTEKRQGPPKPPAPPAPQTHT